MVAMRDSSKAALAVGRFAGWEPLGFEAGDENWYRFVANAPTERTDASGQWSWDGDWIQKGVGGLVGLYGSEVFVEGWSSNLNVAIHKDIHTQAAAARAQAWLGYCDATNPVDAGANLLFGVGLSFVGEGFAHGGLGIAEVVSLGALRGGGKCAAAKSTVTVVGRSVGARESMWRGKKITNELAEALGIGRKELGRAVEKIKEVWGMRGDHNVTIGLATGDVYDSKTGEFLGNVLNEIGQY